jgi:hypothetical protein
MCQGPSAPMRCAQPEWMLAACCSRSVTADAGASRWITCVGHSSIGTQRMLNARTAAVVSLQATLRPAAPVVLDR